MIRILFQPCKDAFFSVKYIQTKYAKYVLSQLNIHFPSKPSTYPLFFEIIIYHLFNRHTLNISWTQRKGDMNTSGHQI